MAEVMGKFKGEQSTSEIDLFKMKLWTETVTSYNDLTKHKVPCPAFGTKMLAAAECHISCLGSIICTCHNISKHVNE